MVNLTQINYIAPCNIRSCRRCNKCLRKINFVYYWLLCIVNNIKTFCLYQSLSKQYTKWIVDNNKIIEHDADHICMHFVESPARSMLYRLSVVFNFGIISTIVVGDLVNFRTRDPGIESCLHERRVCTATKTWVYSLNNYFALSTMHFPRFRPAIFGFKWTEMQRCSSSSMRTANKSSLQNNGEYGKNIIYLFLFASFFCRLRAILLRRFVDILLRYLHKIHIPRAPAPSRLFLKTLMDCWVF